MKKIEKIEEIMVCENIYRRILKLEKTIFIYIPLRCEEAIALGVDTEINPALRIAVKR